MTIEQVPVSLLSIFMYIPYANPQFSEAVNPFDYSTGGCQLALNFHVLVLTLILSPMTAVNPSDYRTVGCQLAINFHVLVLTLILSPKVVNPLTIVQVAVCLLSFFMSYSIR